MADVDDLVARVGDKQLRSQLASAIAELRKTRDFGLVFERHIPETVRLHNHPVRRGIKATLRSSNDKTLYLVERTTLGTATVRPIRRPDGSTIDPAASADAVDVSINDLVAVAEFGDPVYPGLKQVGSINRGGDRPTHVVINGENHHVLEALQFTHAGKVDCIYIDPPYNTGARDWRYGNDYVDDNDAYRNSKWLAFMERRLKLARHLLKPDGVLVVTIDEHEVSNLGVLLRQTLPAARIQMVTIVMNTAGSMSPGLFSRAEEYAYFCWFGNSKPARMSTDLLSGSPPTPQFWFPLFRSRGLNDRPSRRPNLVYPIAVDPATLTIRGTGPSLRDRVAAGEIKGNLDEWQPDDESIDGQPVVWPILDTGELTTWQVSAETLSELADEGFVRVRRPRQDGGTRPFTLAYVKSGNRKKALSGEIETVGWEPSGARILGGGERDTIPKSTWKVASHDARLYGTTMLRALIGVNSFTYPKSPYAVADTLKTVVADNPDAVVLDFFAGSGTTLQSVAMVNREDAGRRQAIIVTNNEVAEPIAALLAADSHYPGAAEYEKQGIFYSVTVPRVDAAITGARSDGRSVEGSYLDGTPIADGFDENVQFLELTYEDPVQIELDMAFKSIAPVLWLRAGGAGPLIEERSDEAGRCKPFAWTDRYGVLFNTDRWRRFVAGLPETVTTVFIVTDSTTVFSQVASELPTDVEPVRLYERYLTTFTTNTDGGA